MNDKAKLVSGKPHVPDEDMQEGLEDESLEELMRDIDASIKREETGPHTRDADADEGTPDDDLGHVVPED